MMKLITKLALPLAIMMAPSAAYADLDTSGADWAATTGTEFINVGPATDTLEMVNFLLCIMENSNMGDHVNETYSAMIDENICWGKGETTPAFATQTLVTSRATNTADYLVTSYFLTDDDMQVISKSVIQQAPSDDLPRGVFTMTWNALVPDTDTPSGAGGILSAKADGSLSYIEIMTEDNENFVTTYIHGALNSDGSGQLRVKDSNAVYLYAIDANSVHYNNVDGTDVECKNRTVSSMAKRPNGYKLFTAAGVEHVIEFPAFSFSYIDGSSNSRRGWAGQQDVWLEGNEQGGDRPTSVVHSTSGKTYTTCFEDDDDGTCAGNDNGDNIYYTLTHADDGVFVTTPQLEFDSIDFTDTATGDSILGSVAWGDRQSDSDDGTDFFASYLGAGDHLNMDMECKLSGEWEARVGSNCNDSNNWRPAYGMPDGTELIASGTKYYVKAIDSALELADHASTNCTFDQPNLLLSAAPGELSSYALPDVASTTLWSARPTASNGGLPAANVMKVIHGVEQ